MTDEQYIACLKKPIGLDYPDGRRAIADEAHRIGVAAERKRCAEVCRRLLNDNLIDLREQCARAIERGEDV